MSSASGTQITMPPLVQLNNTNTKLPHLAPGSQLVFTDGKQLQTRCIVQSDSLKSTVYTTKPVATTSKVTVDGKMVDIDVLTKLQQQNVGNIVSFTASKEFISNLTNSRLTFNKNPTSNNKKMDQSVFRLNNVATINTQGNVLKVSQEKLLLPKTSITSAVNSKRDRSIEVKKFVPEMKGLLTGLSTALKTSIASPYPQQTQAQQQSIQLLKTTTNIFPVANVVSSNFPSGKGSLLIAVKTTTKPSHTSVASTNSLPAISTFKTKIPAKTIRPVIHYQPKQILNKNTIQTRDGLTLTQHKKTTVSKQIVTQAPSKKTNYLQKASSVSASIDTGRINMFLKTTQQNSQELSSKYNGIINTSAMDSRKAIPTKVVTTLINWGKNTTKQYGAVSQPSSIPTNLNPSLTKVTSSKIYHPQYVDTRTKLSKSVSGKITSNQKENKNKDEDSSLCGFTELYEKAVRNVLNLKAFPGETIEKENEAAKKEIEKSYQKYLETPTEFEKKLKRDLSSKFGSKDDDEPDAKKNKLERLSSKFRYTLPDIDQLNSSQSTVRSNLFDFEDIKSERRKTPKAEVDMENLKFFSQFLSEQASTNLVKTKPFYSRTDYPWLHPMYAFDQYYRMASYLPSISPYYSHKDYPKTFPPPLTKSTNIMKASDTTTKDTNDTENTINTTDNEPQKMKLNTMKKIKNKRNNDEDIKIKISPDEEIKKITKNKTKEKLRTNSNSNRSTPVQEKEKKAKAKEVLKIKRYTLRQRALALKKAKKLAIEMPREPPKYILKELTAKNVTRKETFLGVLGLRRILKRLEKKTKEEK